MSHDELKELVPGFALSALDPTEMAAFQQHVATCDECAPNLAEMKTLVGTLPLLATEQALPVEFERSGFSRLYGPRLPGVIFCFDSSPDGAQCYSGLQLLLPLRW